MLSVARFDITMLAVVVADMVLKPSFDDYAVLIAMAVVLVAAAAYFLMPLRSARPATA
jgi:xanthine/uracil permease